MKIINKILKVFFILILSFICYQFSYTYASNEYISNENLTYKELSDGTTLLSGFEIGTKVSEIINGYFSSGYDIKIFDNNNNDITGESDNLIGTGYQIKLYTFLADIDYNNTTKKNEISLSASLKLEKTYTIVLYGDTNGDGNINAVDALTVVKNKLELISFTNSAVEEAGRINENTRKTGDIPSSVDALSIVKYKLEPEKYPIDQKLYIEETSDDNNAIYVSLYDDGTLVFTATDRVLEGKTLVKSYGDIYNNKYNYGGSPYDIPAWCLDKDKISKIYFEDEIKPQHTALWFWGCSNIKNIENIEKLDTSNVTNMSEMFSGCSGLTELNLSNFNTSNVTSMAYMFTNCSGLTDLNLSNFNTSNVTNMSHMFSGCSGLTELNLSNFDTSNTIDMSDMFELCTSLTNLDISNFNTSKVYSMQNMFRFCENLSNLDLSSFDTSNVDNMLYMFSGCSKLTLILVGENWTTENAYTSDMFSGCGTDHVTVKN